MLEGNERSDRVPTRARCFHKIQWVMVSLAVWSKKWKWVVIWRQTRGETDGLNIISVPPLKLQRKITHAFSNSLLDNLIQTYKGSTQNKQDIWCIDVIHIRSRFNKEIHYENHPKSKWCSRVARWGVRWPCLGWGSPVEGRSTEAPPFACTVTTDPSIIRKSACWTPSPPTSREPSVPELDLRAILSISSI